MQGRLEHQVCRCRQLRLAEVDLILKDSPSYEGYLCVCLMVCRA